MKSATCLARPIHLWFMIFLLLPLSQYAQTGPGFWRKPDIKAGGSTFPVIQFSANYSGVWLREKGVVLVPQELVEDLAVDEENRLLSLTGHLILAQQSMPVGIPSQDIGRMQDSLTRSLPVGPGKKITWQKSETGYAEDMVLWQEIGNWTIVNRIPEFGVTILKSPELAPYASRVKGEVPEDILTARDTLQLIGFPESSHYIAPTAKRRHYWLRENPFRQQILDSLGYTVPGAVARRAYLFDQQDPLTQLYRAQWPYRQAIIVTDALPKYGHPFFRIVQVIYAISRQEESKLRDKAFVQAITVLIQTLYDAGLEEETNENLAKTLEVYFTGVSGALISPVLAEAARFHQKDYDSLARAVRAKSRLFASGRWLSDWEEDPVATLDAIQKDYGYVLLQQMLYGTVERATEKYEAVNQQVYERERVYYENLAGPNTRRQANGSLRLSEVVLESGIPLRATIAPGMNGAAVLHQDGTTAGILLTCTQDNGWGNWHPQTELICSRFVSVSDIMNSWKE